MAGSKLAFAFLAGGLVVAVGGWAVYQEWFAPEGSTQADEAFPDLGTTPDGSPADAQPLRQGVFTGADGFHYARGMVALFQAADGGFVLRFEDYEAREGPDVYLYLTRNAGDRTTEAVEGQGVRILVPGGAEGGQATRRGTFNVPVPDGVDALAYGGVTIWCDDFNQFFGHAPLAPP